MEKKRKIGNSKAMMIILLLVFSAVPLVAAEDSRETTERDTIRNAEALVSDQTQVQRGVDMAIQRVSQIVEQRSDMSQQQKDFYERGAEKCENTDDPELCKSRLEERARQAQAINDNAVRQLKEVAENRMQKTEQLRETLQSAEFRAFDPGNGFKARDIAKDKMSQARNAYQDARQNYADSRDRYASSKDDFDISRTELRGCQQEGADCAEIDDKVNEAAKRHLYRMTEMIINNLEMLKNRIESNEQIAQAEASDMLDDIKLKIDQLNEISEKIEAAETKDEIQALAAELRTIWQETEKGIGIYSGKVVNSQIGGIIVRSEQMQIKLDMIMERMIESGLDVSEVQPFAERFENLIGSAKEDYSSAMELLNEAKSSARPDTDKIRAGHELIRSANNSLQDAQKVLTEMMKKIGEQGGASFVDDEAQQQSLAAQAASDREQR